MATDIIRINSSVGINNSRAVMSTTVTGSSSVLTLLENYPSTLTIQNIESKYNNKFDDITYYVCCSGVN
jgi:methyltransferase-like protein